MRSAELDVIYTRRSVRSYKPQTPDESTIRELLDAAVQAPTVFPIEARRVGPSKPTNTAICTALARRRRGTTSPINWQIRTSVFFTTPARSS